MALWLSGSNIAAALQASAPLVQWLQCSMVKRPLNFPLAMWAAVLDMQQETFSQKQYKPCVVVSGTYDVDL